MALRLRQPLLSAATNEIITVTAGSLTIEGQAVTVRETEVIPVDAGSLTLAGQTVTEREIEAVAAGALTLTGGDVTVTDTAPPIVGRPVGGGSGLGPASPAKIAANEEYERRERDLWRRIEDTIAGKKRPEPKQPAKTRKTSIKSLPSAAKPEPVQVEPVFEQIFAAIMAETVPVFIARTDLHFYDPDEDAAVLMLLG